MSVCIDEIISWMKANPLQLNSTETEFVLSSSAPDPARTNMNWQYKRVATICSP